MSQKTSREALESDKGTEGGTMMTRALYRESLRIPRGCGGQSGGSLVCGQMLLPRTEIKTTLM